MTDIDLIRELEEIESLKIQRRRRSMIYQADLKDEVASINNASQGAYYHLDYSEWEAIRNEYLNKQDIARIKDLETTIEEEKKLGIDPQFHIDTIVRVQRMISNRVEK